MSFTKKHKLKNTSTKIHFGIAFCVMVLFFLYSGGIKAVTVYENKSTLNMPVIEMVDSAAVCYASPFHIHPYISACDSLLWETNGDGHFSQTTIINPVYYASLADSAAAYIKIFLTAFSSYGNTKDSLVLHLSTTAVADAGPDTEMCQGDNVQLFATGGSNYYWNYPLSMCCPAIHNPVAWPSSTRTYIVTVSGPCGTATDSVTVFVNPKPNVHISPQTALYFCDGDSIMLTAPYINNMSYTWFRNDTAIPSATDTLYYASEGGLYKVFVTDSLGCTNFSNILSVDALSLPSATISTSDSTSFCEGDSITLIVNTAPANIYRWYMNDSLISNNDNQPLTVYESGTYYAVVTDTAGCYISTSDTETTLWPAPPQPLITAHNDTLYSSSHVGNQWFKDNQTITGATDRAYFPTATGSYTVQVSSPKGCLSEMSEPYLFTSVFKNELLPDFDFVIYPNPAQKSLHIHFFNHQTQSVALKIYNYLGQEIYAEEKKIQNERISLSLLNFNSGLYILEIATELHKLQKKLIIE